MTRAPFLLLTLALMCENVNAAPQVPASEAERQVSSPAVAAPFTLASDMPPFKLSDPMCNTGFTISMRLDTRNAAGTIIKSVWVRKCTNGRIVYGRKV